MATRNTNRGNQNDQNHGNDTARRMNASGGGREGMAGREAGAAPGTSASAGRGTAQNSGASATSASGVRTGVTTNSGAASAGRSNAGATPSQSSDRARTDRQRVVETSRETGTRESTRPSSIGGTQSGRQGTTRGGTSGAGLAQRGQTSPVYGGYGLAGSPFAMMRRMMEDMDRLFSDFGAGPGLLPSTIFSGQGLGVGESGSSLEPSLPQGIWSPQIEVFERGNDLVVRADLPGLTRDDVDVELENDTLLLRGHRQNEHENSREGYYQSERSYGSFYRAIPLPEGISADACNATFQNGVLEVTIPKPQKETLERKKVRIK